MNALILIGYLFELLGIIDFLAGRIFGVDFTGVAWSPLVLGGIGAILIAIGEKDNKKPEDDDSDKTGKEAEKEAAEDDDSDKTEKESEKEAAENDGNHANA